MSGALFAASLAGLLVCVSVEVVVVHVLRGVLSVSGVGDGIETAVGHVVPPGLGLVSEKQVSAVLPSEPLVHLLRKVPNLVAGFFMEPVV